MILQKEKQKQALEERAMQREENQGESDSIQNEKYPKQIICLPQPIFINWSWNGNNQREVDEKREKSHFNN